MSIAGVSSSASSSLALANSLTRQASAPLPSASPTPVTLSASQFSSGGKLVTQLGIANVNVADNAANVVRVGSKLSTVQQVTVTDTAAHLQSTWQSLVTLASCSGVLARKATKLGSKLAM